MRLAVFGEHENVAKTGRWGEEVPWVGLGALGPEPYALGMDRRFENLSNVRLGDVIINARRHGQAAKLAAVAGGLVVAVPLILLAVAGIVVAIATFFAVSIVLRAFDGLGRIYGGLTGSFSQRKPQDEGRVNVRVIHREGM